ncbi:MAG: methionyl-tRNA formyltransferase [Bacillota bacterium]|nr:methionyl-tRNA formyltransferase [Bacillota bacterium]
MKLIYMGTPEFAVEPLKELVKAGHEILCVVTQPDKPKNRGKKLQPTPVKEAALEMNLEVVQPEKIKGNTEFIEYIKGLGADLAIVAAYGKLLPKEILDAPKMGCLNIHASLLPKLRGAAPIQRAILEGYLFSGVTIMKMDEGLDTGNMISKSILSIAGMTADILHDELMTMGAEMIVEVLKKVEEEGEAAITGEKQDDSQATYAPMIKKEDGRIDFSRRADDILLQINALEPWPSAFTYYKGTQVKLKDPEWYGSAREYREPGTILSVSKKGVVIQCGGDLLLIKKVQFANKKAMSVAEYIKGNELEEGVVLGREEI